MKDTKQKTPASESKSTRRSFDQQQPAAAGRWEIPFISQRRGGMMQSYVQETDRVAKEAEKIKKQEEETWFDRIRKEAERHQMQEYLWQNMPQSIGLFSDANELARRFLAEENLDKSNVDILKERNKYFLAELKKIHLWLDHKENLSKEKRMKLEYNRDRITEILNTPLSLNPKIDVTKFHVLDMKEEIPRIMNWLDHQPEGTDGGVLIENVQKMLLLLELYENPPGYWGIQKETHLRFFNIKQPGYSIRTIAFYFYGDFEKSHLITLADGTPAPGFVPGGQSVLFDSSSWSDMTRIVNTGVEPWLKIEGPIPDFTASTDHMMSVELAGKTYQLYNSQYPALVSNVFETKRNNYEYEIEYLKSQLKVYSDTRSSTYKFVRVYSDYAGGASFDTAYFRNVIKNAEAYLKEIAQYSKETVSPDVVNQVHSRLKTIKIEGEILVDALMGYFNDTVRGAASVIQTLEVVKTVGSVAAVFIPGVGLVYGGIQNAAQQASGLAHGTQQSWNFKSSAREFALGLAGYGAGKVAGAGVRQAGQFAKAAGQSAAKWAGKYAPNVSAKLAGGAGKMAEKLAGKPGRFIAGMGQNVMENVVASPLVTQVDKLVTEGRFAQYDEIIKDIGNQFSLQNLAMAGAATAVQGKLPDDIHLAGKNPKALPSLQDTFKPAVLGKKSKTPKSATPPPPAPVREQTRELAPSQPATPPVPHSAVFKPAPNATPTAHAPAPTPPSGKIPPPFKGGMLSAGDVVLAPDLASSNVIYNNMMKEQPHMEVAIFHNPDTGETIVVQGAETVVGVRGASGDKMELPQPGQPQPMKEILDHPDAGRWELLSHYHPLVDQSGSAPLPYRFPSGKGGDFDVLQYESAIGGGIMRDSWIHYQTPQGKRFTHFKYDPAASRPFSISYFDPVTNRPAKVEFATLSDYHAWTKQSFDFDPGAAPQPASSASQQGVPAPARSPAQPDKDIQDSRTTEDVFRELHNELGLDAAGTTKYRSHAEAAKAAMEMTARWDPGAVGQQQPSPVNGQAAVMIGPHWSAPDIRQGLSWKGRESAHINPTGFLKTLPTYNRNRAPTFLLNRITHKSFDDYWKKWVRVKRAELASKGLPLEVSVADYYKIMSEAIEQIPNLSDDAKGALHAALTQELFSHVGPDAMLPLPKL